MKITSRYADDPRVVIDPTNVPEQFRHLIPLAQEWSISDDRELESYINSCSGQDLHQFATAFRPHFDGLWQWHKSCEAMIPQPDELVLFDIAANAAAGVIATLA